MSIPNIRLAFQGGGAKLAAMLPYADAFYTAHYEGTVNIRSVSGTSAGAICAALVATEADFESVRDYLIEKGPNHLSKLVPGQVASLAKNFKVNENLSWWQILKNVELFNDILFSGNPILQSDALKDLISGVFSKANGVNSHNINDLNIDLFVSASDISKSRGVTHSSGNLLAALVDSCSLPVLLRSFSDLSATHYVDGGLCDNLPVDCLIGPHQDSIFAVFPSSKPIEQKIDNFLKYLSSLLSASINHSATRSVKRVSKPFQVEVQTDLDLLDFKEAIDAISDENWYDAEKNRILKRLENFSLAYGGSISPNEARVADVQEIDSYHRLLSNLTQKQSQELKSISGQFIVKVNSDKVNNVDGEREPDTITRVSNFEILEDDVEFYRTNVKVASDSIVPTIWSVKNLTKDLEIPISALPLNLVTKEGLEVRECLIEFVDRSLIEKGDIIQIQSIYHTAGDENMSKLNRREMDYFGFRHAGIDTLGVADLILIYPKKLGNLRLLLDTDRSKNIESTPFLKGDLSDLQRYVGQKDRITGLSLKNMPSGSRFYAAVISN